MIDFVTAVALGMAAGLLLALARRQSWVAWLVFLPLCAAVYFSALPAAAAAGLAFGCTAMAFLYLGRYGAMSRSVAPLAIGLAGVVTAVGCGLAALVWPGGAPAWGVVLFPPAVVIPFAALQVWRSRLANPLLVILEGSRTAVHAARLLPDFALPALPALAAAAVVALFAQWPPGAPAIAAAAVAVAVVLAIMATARRRMVTTGRLVEHARRLRVAAVSVDGDDLPGPFTGPAYRDVEGTVRRYDPHIQLAVQAGARLVVLPEVAVTVDTDGERRWLEALAGWALRGHVVVVAGLMNEDLPSNRLAIAGADGRILTVYDKQHPVAGVEPVRYVDMPPARATVEDAPLSAVICYDADFNDLVAPLARSGGILANPTNDWSRFTEIHHRAAVWEAVETGTSLVRAAGHGISSIYSPDGRVLRRGSSFDGPVVLVADVPVLAA